MTGKVVWPVDEEVNLSKRYVVETSDTDGKGNINWTPRFSTGFLSRAILVARDHSPFSRVVDTRA